MFKRLWYFVLRSLGLAPYREIEILIGEILKLESELESVVTELTASEDERASLWMMLDELEESSKIGEGNVADLVKNLQDVLVGEMLKDFDPVGEA